MDQGGQQNEMNITRALEALSPYLNNPRRTVIRIEVFVGVSVSLMFLQVILGSCRRRSSNSIIQCVLWLAYTFSFPLIAYTLGQMFSSPVKNGLYPLWATLIFWAVGCTNSITAYDLDDNKRWRRYLIELLQYAIYADIILHLLIPSKFEFSLSKAFVVEKQPIAISIDILITLVIFTNLVRAISGWIVTNSYHSKVVEDYMRGKVDHIANDHVSVDPITMEGYKYIVFLPSHLLGDLKVGAGPTYRYKLPADGIITIDAIWKRKFDDSWLNTDGGGSRLNDVCLSFALSHLLKRRFFGMECAEAGHEETRKFVSEALLSHEDGVTRAFRIIEVELGFLYDFFFTKYATLFHMERSFIAMAVLRIIVLSTSVALLLRGSPTIETLNPVIEVGTRSVDTSITIVIMGILLLIEALQVILYLMSDWATVSLACGYSRRGACNKLIPFVIWLLRRFNLSKYWTRLISDTKFGKSLHGLNLFGYWGNRMGQSSVFAYGPFWSRPNRITAWMDDLFCLTYIWAHFKLMEYMFEPSEKTAVRIPDLVKTEIVSCIQKTSIGGRLNNGEAALRRNVELGDFSWTLENRSQTMTMLIWHIATEYCNFPSSTEMEEHQSGAQEEENVQIDNYKQVAAILSRYCVYLIAFVPTLLPGDSMDTLFVYDAVVNEIKDYGKKSKAELLKVIMDYEGRRVSETEDDIIIDGLTNNNNEDDDTIIEGSINNNNEEERIMVEGLTNNNNEDNIFMKGLKLGKALEEIEDIAIRWKVLAEFWAETIIYIAPSDNATAHMERLAQGGEFLTHVWALLTHAGILQRGDQEKTPEDVV